MPYKSNSYRTTCNFSITLPADTYKGKILQIPRDELRYSYRKTKVNVHEYLDGRIALFHGPRKLVEFPVEASIRINTDVLTKAFLYSLSSKQQGIQAGVRETV